MRKYLPAKLATQVPIKMKQVVHLTRLIFSLGAAKLVVVVLAPVLLSRTAQAQLKDSVFVARGTGGTWCAFKRREEWVLYADSNHSYVVSTVVTKAAHITAVDVTTTDETGDWAVFDHYVLGLNGRVERIDRRVNTADRKIVKQVFVARHGRLEALSRAYFDFDSGRRSSDTTAELPDIPLHSALADFAFAEAFGLVDTNRPDRSRTCWNAP